MWRFVIYIECPCVAYGAKISTHSIQFVRCALSICFRLSHKYAYENDMWKMRFNLWLIIQSVWNDIIKVAHNSILLILLNWQQGIDGSSICRHRFDFVVKLKYRNHIIQLTTANFAINSNCARSKWRTYFQSEFVAGIKFNFQRVIILWFLFRCHISCCRVHKHRHNVTTNKVRENVWLKNACLSNFRTVHACTLW